MGMNSCRELANFCWWNSTISSNNSETERNWIEAGSHSPWIDLVLMLHEPKIDAPIDSRGIVNRLWQMSFWDCLFESFNRFLFVNRINFPRAILLAIAFLFLKRRNLLSIDQLAIFSVLSKSWIDDLFLYYHI